MGNIEMKKEKKGNLSCRKHFKGADFSFRSGMMRVQIPRGTPLGLRTAMREGRERGARTQFFSSSQVCILTHAHAEHAGTFLRFTTCTAHLQGSFGLSQTTQPNKHIQLQPSLPLSPPAAAAGRGPTAYTEVEQTTAG